MWKKDAYRVYLLTRFFQSLFFTTIGTYTALYRINVVGLNPLQLVLVGTVLEITTFFFEIPTGVVADVFSRKISTVIGVILVGLGFMFEALFPTFITVLIAQVIWGIGFTFISGAREAWITGEVGETTANKAFFTGARLSQVGAFLGVLISMVLATISVRLPIFVGGLFHALWGISLFFLMPEEHFHSTKPEERSNWHHMWHTLKSGISVVKQSRLLLVVIVAGGIYGMFSEGFDRLWTAHLIKNFAFPTVLSISQTTWFGIIYLVTLVFTYIGIGIVNKHVDKESESAIIKGFVVLIGGIMLATLGFAFAPNFYVAVICTWFVFMFREATSPLYNGILNKESVEHVRATVFSIASQSNALGQIVGGPILGFIATYFSLRTGMFGAAFALFPVLLLLFFGMKLRKKQV